MLTLGSTLSVRGEVRAADDLTIEGRVDGPVFSEEWAVVVAPGAEVKGDILARDITVFGRVVGQLVATEVVDIRANAVIEGTIVSSRFILDPGARFLGRVEPQHLDAAVRVAHFEQRRRDAAAAESAEAARHV